MYQERQFELLFRFMKQKSYRGLAFQLHGLDYS
jgi:hypothetical protein